MQNICNEMDGKAYEFLEVQRAYHTNRLDSRHLTEYTTQPFWQSMRLGKRRLESKGLTMDVQITRDKKNRTIRDERLCMRRDGHHLVGNKAMNVIAHRTFYKNGKILSAFKNKEICNMALLKTEVNGNQAACPNCGHINRIDSFIDGCDACGSKFQVQDFKTKMSGFSLEENTSAAIKGTITKDALVQGALTLGWVLLAMLTGLFGIIAVTFGGEGINFANVTLALATALNLFPVIVGNTVLLGLIYLVAAIILVAVYKKRIVKEEVVKKVLPTFSAGDFYQNLEYKLRNIHLTDREEEVSAFARCSLGSAIKDYRNVVECDMTRLKFNSIEVDSDGYRMGAEAILRLTEYRGNRILIKYEKLKLRLFGKPQVVEKPVAALREYKCPGCGTSINILEGGRCDYCGNTFDYSEYGWVIESYKNRRQPLSVFQKVKWSMTGLFILVVLKVVLFPFGLDEGNIFWAHERFEEVIDATTQAAPKLKTPIELYENVEEKKVGYDPLGGGFYIYGADDAAGIAEQYRTYLDSENMEFYKELENGYVFFQYHHFDVIGMEEDMYYCVAVIYGEEYIVIQKEFIESMEEDLEAILENMEEELEECG